MEAAAQSAPTAPPSDRSDREAHSSHHHTSCILRQVLKHPLTEKLRILMQCLTTTTDDRVPLFVRIADADPRLRHYLFGRQRPGMRIERLSWYWRFLLMIVLVRHLNSREKTGVFYDLRVLTQLWCIASTGVFCKTFLSKAFR